MEHPVSREAVQQPEKAKGTSDLLQRDMEYFEHERARMMHKILSLTTQLDGARHEADKYKRIWDKVKSGIRKADQKQSIAQQMMMAYRVPGGGSSAVQLTYSQKRQPKQDSSVENSL